MYVLEVIPGATLPAFPSRFLIVTVGGRYLALDAESICGLLTLEEAGAPGDPIIHGMAYRVIDLAYRLSVLNDPDGTNSRVVLLYEREARGSIRVSTVQGLLELQPSQVLPLPMQFRGPERHWYRGMILFAENIALVLNTPWILEEQASNSDGRSEQGGAPQLMAAPKMSMNDRRIC